MTVETVQARGAGAGFHGHAQAVALPGATVQIRQNLAYVLGIRGNLTEAERLVRADLPPEAANNNIAYLRALSAPGG